ncbi:MAG: DUF1573 domain-containing protein [Bacteroidota bacterium]|nr:DUF1573 domain-containing protein [Bacteroidota bacterium]
MKYLVVLIICVLMITGISYSQSKIEVVGGTNFDFGDIYVGTKTEKIITIKNKGKDTLVINNVQASCGCTATLLSERLIPAGKSATLNVGFDSKGFDGKVHKTVTITSNDSANSPVQINFTANVKSVLKFEPLYIYFQQMKSDSTATTKITVKNNTTEAIEILSAQHKVQGLQVDIMQRKLMPNESTQISVSYAAFSEGMMQGEVTFNTNNKQQPKIPLRFFAYVRAK